MNQKSLLWSPEFPFSPAKLPFFYGWVVIVLAGLGVVGSLPGQTVGVSPFTETLLSQLGLTREELSRAYLFGTLGSGLLLPSVGGWMDAFGIRKMCVFGGCVFGLVVMVHSQLQNLVQGIGSAVHQYPFAVECVPVVVITILFFLIRFLGQGLLAMASRAMLGKWFFYKRGMAFALFGVLISACFAVYPGVLHRLIGSVGWERTYLYVGGCVCLGVSLMAWVFFRDNPEECGFHMDGAATPPQDERPKNEDLLIVKEMTKGETLRTYSFWISNLSLSFVGFFITAYTFHIASIGEEAGITEKQMFEIFAYMSFVGIGGTFLSGWLADRTRVKYVLMLMMGGMIMGIFGLIWLHCLWGQLLLMAGIGFSSGSMGMLNGVIWPRFFGRKHLGAISGMHMSSIVIASALGPYLYSLSDKYFGSYQPAHSGALALAFLLALGTVKADNPQRLMAK